MLCADCISICLLKIDMTKSTRAISCQQRGFGGHILYRVQYLISHISGGRVPIQTFLEHTIDELGY